MDRPLNHLYFDLERQLGSLNAEMMAAEGHGVLCARFCIKNTPDVGLWMQEVLGSQETGNLQAKESERLLTQLYDETYASFLEAMDGFDMLLPGDDEALVERTQALVDWCSGFVAGLGLSGFQNDESLDEQVKEVLQDLIEITHMDDEIEDTEENETAYMEITEYVRVAVMTIGLSLRVRDPEQTLH